MDQTVRMITVDDLIYVKLYPFTNPREFMNTVEIMGRVLQISYLNNTWAYMSVHILATGAHRFLDKAVTLLNTDAGDFTVCCRTSTGAAERYYVDIQVEEKHVKLLSLIDIPLYINYEYKSEYFKKLFTKEA